MNLVALLVQVSLQRPSYFNTKKRGKDTKFFDIFAATGGKFQNLMK